MYKIIPIWKLSIPQADYAKKAGCNFAVVKEVEDSLIVIGYYKNNKDGQIALAGLNRALKYWR